MPHMFQIAIDGPSAAGKSTIARKVAAALDIDYIDTGAMYRAVAYKLQQERIELSNHEGIKKMLARTDIDFSNGDTLLDGIVISDRIRTAELSKLASDASALPLVREKLVALQRAIGQSKSVIMDGRDIGTNVFPNAEYKFFLTASVQERAKRRWLEMRDKGQEIEYEKVEADIAIRDYNDSTRALNPLQKAEDAIGLDTTAMTIQEVTDLILKAIHIKTSD
jgi:cytidylate kinase